jgi:hypothetical protein
VALDTVCATAGACQQYNVTSGAYVGCSGAACSRLPGQTSEGDLPKMALVQAAGDQLECLMRKIGVADSEFTVASGGGKVSLFSDNGMTSLAGETAESALWGDAVTGAGATFDNYGAVISPCDNNHSTYPGGGVAMTPPSTNSSQAPTASAAWLACPRWPR